MNTNTLGRREFIKYGLSSSLVLLSGCSTSQKKLALRGVANSFPSEFVNSLSTGWEFFPIKDIEFKKINSYGEWIEVSEPIVMASAAGWYVGAVCKDPDCGGMIVPYNRFTEYMTQEKAQVVLDTPIDEGGFNEDFGVVEMEFGT